MKTYRYPKDLGICPTQWFWSLKAVALLGILAVLSVLSVLYLKMWLLCYLTVILAVLTMRNGEKTMLERLKQAVRFFFGTQTYGGDKCRY